MMNSTTLLNIYAEEKECSYKGERYSVRDNGAVYRYKREGKRIRKDDERWTFGVPNMKTGYMEIGSERVHRIVAYAFIGEPPTSQHVVDHIDTNRRNNRPTNLRWLTRLENVLCNPITRHKIEYYCGSVDEFLSNPTVRKQFAKEHPNYGWMRAVSPEDARACLDTLTALSKLKNVGIPSNGLLGEWVYKAHEFSDIRGNVQQSLTTNSSQREWYTPTEFPLCPSEPGEEPLVAYMRNLNKGEVVSQNKHVTFYVDDFALDTDNNLVITGYAQNQCKNFALITVAFVDGSYVHESRTFFEARGAQKAFMLAQNLEWNGAPGIDDYC